MRFRTIQASAVRSVFEVLKDILNDVNIYFDESGMRILTLDTARVALVDVHLLADNFEEYTCASPITAGINVTNIHKLLKIINTSDIMMVEVKSTDYMDILIESSQKNTKTSFQLKLLDIDDNQIEVPDIDMSVITTLPSVDFQRICRDMGNISTELTIARTQMNLTVSCAGDFANQETTIKCTGDEKVCVDYEIRGVYSLKYLNLFTKATSMCSILQIMQERANRFLVLKYNVANLGELKFYLATKIEEEA